MKIKFVNDRVQKIIVRLDDQLYHFCESHDIETPRVRCGSQTFYELPEGEVEINKPFGDYSESFESLVELADETGCRVALRLDEGNINVEILVG